MEALQFYQCKTYFLKSVNEFLPIFSKYLDAYNPNVLNYLGLNGFILIQMRSENGFSSSSTLTLIGLVIHLTKLAFFQVLQQKEFPNQAICFYDGLRLVIIFLADPSSYSISDQLVGSIQSLPGHNYGPPKGASSKSVRML